MKARLAVPIRCAGDDKNRGLSMHRLKQQHAGSVLVVLVGLVWSTVLQSPSVATAQALSFQGLGDLPGEEFWSEARGISPYGHTVVGSGKSWASDRDAFRWTTATGIQRLGDIPPGAYHPQPSDASAFGTVVVGYMAYRAGTSQGYCQGYYWTEADGFDTLPYVDAKSDAGWANGVSADGSVIVGTEGHRSARQAVRWIVGAGGESLGFLQGSQYSRGIAVSHDGSCAVGYGFGLVGQEAFRYVGGGPMEGLGDLSGGNFKSSALAVSDDGSVIVGYGTTSRGYEAFRWTVDERMRSLGDVTISARGVSSDGSVVVGYGRGDYAAFIWDPANGTRSLYRLLEDGGIDLSGWTFEGAIGVSSNGRIIAGRGWNPNGDYESWVLTIPEPTTLSLLAMGSLIALRRRRRR